MYVCIYIYIYIYVKLFVICFKIPHTQIPYHMAASQFNPNERKITGFPKIRNTRAGDPKTESFKKVNKNGLK